jgi:hypothetical protein
MTSPNPWIPGRLGSWGDKVRVINPTSFHYGHYGVIGVFAENKEWSEYEIRFRDRSRSVTVWKKFKREDLEKVSEEEYAANEVISA